MLRCLAHASQQREETSHVQREETSHVKNNAKQQQAAWPAKLLMIYSPSSDGSRPKPVKGAPGGNRAFAQLPGPGSELQSADLAAKSQPLSAAGRRGRFWHLLAPPRCAGRRARRQKTKSRVGRSSTRVLAVPWRRGRAESNQGRKPA